MNLISKLKRWFATPEEEQGVSFEQALAVLLLEVVRVDGRVDEREQHAVEQALVALNACAANEAEALIREAEALHDTAVDYFQFSQQVKQALSAEQRIAVVEQFWQIAYADGHLDAHEEHAIRKLADLFYVSHGDFIRSKLDAQANSSVQ